ncbi:MAG: TRAP-type C4-dicarboxylate transport system, large permease component [Firmicutes bacterium]|nr:TRAP-type C4-dicarboxylate transport system, large permease component [Bacillota bacterium]
MIIFTFLIVCFAVLITLGVPIYATLSLSSLLSVLFFTSTNVVVITQKIFGGIDKFALMAVPFYVFAADIMIEGGMAKRLLDWVNSLLRGFRGSTAIATQAACSVFGSLSGSSPATVVAIGSLMYPELINKNYGKGFSTGLLVSSGAAALLIPPSVTFIIYGSVTGVSVGALFMGGIGAGIIYSLAIIAYSYYYACKHNIASPDKLNWQEVWQLTKRAGWSFGVPIIILGGIFMGIFTPTEAAGVSVVYALFVSLFIYRELTIKKIINICIKSSITIAQVMILLGAAAVFSWVITESYVPQTIIANIVSSLPSKYIFLMIINVIFLIAGMFIDGGAAVMMLAPLLFTPAVNIGIDPVHLGVILVANVCIGMFSPPFGLNLFVSTSITGESVSNIAPSVIPFLLVTLIALIIITYLPGISLFLPRLAGY